MDYKRMRLLLQNCKAAYEQICGEVEFHREAPASEAEVMQAEELLGVPLPEQLRDFFLHFSKECSLWTHLPEEFALPKELSGIFSACFNISLKEVIEAEQSRKGWIEGCFPDVDNPYDQVWHNKLGIMTVPNGDVIALDTGADTDNPPVVYLSHDDGEGHGYILGKTFNIYFEALLSVGACGNEDWQMLPFCDSKDSGINPACKNAEKYRELIGLIAD